MSYDLFISYCSADRPWAEKLWRDLKDHVKVYWDQHDLRLGEKWDPQLRQAIADSQHMVILWSTAAKLSDWVQNERTAFLQSAEAQNRRLISVWLEGESAVLGAYQALDDLRKAQLYKPNLPPPAGDPAFNLVWNRVLNRLKTAVLNVEDATPIWLMLFTLTRNEFEQIDPAHSPAWGPSLEELLTNLNIQPKAGGTRRDTILDCYKTTREEWEPFGRHGLTIRRIVDDALTTLNADSALTPHRVQFRWEPVGDDFWETSAISQRRAELREVRSRYVKHMVKDRALIVVDPIAFYSLNGKYFFEQFAGCLDNDKAVVLVVPPFATCAPRVQLHELLRDVVRDFSRYYEPPIPAKRFAACGLGVTDQDDLQRYLRLAVAEHVFAMMAPASNVPALRIK